MTRKKIIAIVAVALAVLVGVGIVVANLIKSDDEIAGKGVSTFPLPIEAKVPDGLKVGVVYSLTGDPLVESSYLRSAEGMQVANYRLAEGGSDIEIIPVDDRGTVEGAQRAVDDLENQGVGAIIVGTAGPHTSAIADAARGAGIPAIFPYEADAVSTADGVWTMGANKTTAANMLGKELTDRGYAENLVIDFDGSLADIPNAKYMTYDENTDFVELGDEIFQVFMDEELNLDAIVINGPSTFESNILSEIQSRAITVPVFFTNHADAPAFIDRLRSEGVLFGDFTTLGLPSVDMVALKADRSGGAAAVFFTAIRLMDDAGMRNLLDEATFAESKDYADGLSHDALVAIASAAADAKSVEPADIEQSLTGLEITTADGTVLGTTTFGATGVESELMSVLRASTQDPNLRESSTPLMFWFAQ
ncbi:ABC transporter substrate-binding protein [Trueperella sp.]|uniref:ABC transporter substrate-binding protein n=1 Tax=Trueperella sp. TaxID=2699835 RepID=UPI003735088D